MIIAFNNLRIQDVMCPMEQTTRDVVIMTTLLAMTALMTYTLYLSCSVKDNSFKEFAKMTCKVISLNYVTVECSALIIDFLKHCPKA